MSAQGRRWLELSVRSPSAGVRESLLADGLVALGARAVAEEDGWYLSHFEEPDDVASFLAQARQLLLETVGAPDVEVRTRWCPHEDWAETWKRGLAPRRITPRLLVTTTWHPVDAAPEEVVIVVDPGMAFGTAEHGTTRGCLRFLDRVVRPGQRILDVGAGSGILSIAAAGLGASDVIALEGDPLAVEAMEENVAQNGVTDRVTVRPTWADAELLASLGPRDGAVANIESGVLRPLLPGFAAAVHSGGWLVLSGILAEEWMEIRNEALAAGFRFVDVDEDGEWRSLLLERSRAPDRPTS